VCCQWCGTSRRLSPQRQVHAAVTCAGGMPFAVWLGVVRVWRGRRRGRPACIRGAPCLPRIVVTLCSVAALCEPLERGTALSPLQFIGCGGNR
jgi:hypothetical protein